MVVEKASDSQTFFCSLGDDIAKKRGFLFINSFEIKTSQSPVRGYEAMRELTRDPFSTGINYINKANDRDLRDRRIKFYF